MPKLGAADAGKDGTTTVGSNQARAKFVEAHLQSSPACEVRRAPAQKKKPRQIRRKRESWKMTEAKAKVASMVVWPLGLVMIGYGIFKIIAG